MQTREEAARTSLNATSAAVIIPVADAELRVEVQVASAAVILPAADAELRVEVEVADTPDRRRKGLMFRRLLPLNTGMLFIFENDDVQAFWMKNTLLPLDMIFLNREKVIVGIIQSAVPQTLEPRSVGLPSRYVLEVVGGFSREHGLKVGQQLRFEGIATDSFE